MQSVFTAKQWPEDNRQTGAASKQARTSTGVLVDTTYYQGGNMKKRMTIQTKLFLTAVIMGLLWLFIVLVTGTYAQAEMPAVPDIEYTPPCDSCNRYYQQQQQLEQQRIQQRRQQSEQGYATPLTPQYANPNDNPYQYNQQRQDLQRAQDQMNQWLYNHQLQQQLQDQRNFNGHIQQQQNQLNIMPMR